MLRLAAVDRYHWLVFLHVTGAFMVLGGAVMAGIFNVTAMRRERPSEVVLLFRLTRFAVTSISIGMVVTLAFGLWLVSEADYGWGEAWIILALVLWVAANALGGIGGKRDTRTRQLAERLAAEGDAPSPELRLRVRDPISLALSWGSGAVVVVILVLMIWKPGA
jgi:uncharacterized membrane protein